MSATPLVPVVLSQHTLLDPPGDPRSSRAHRESSPRSSTNVRHVIACLDGSPLGRGVVPHAQLVAAALGARLTLLHVLEAEIGATDPAMPADPLEWEIRQREARVHLQDVVSQIVSEESPVESELIHGRPAEQICHWADHHDVDLTVLCSHGSRGRTEWDLASTARKLIDRLPGSLLLVPAEVAALGKEPGYSRILVPLDGSARAESVLPLAMRIAADQKAEVLLAHVVMPPELLGLGVPDPQGEELVRRVVEHNRRMATMYLDRLRARLGRADVRVRSVVLSDPSVRSRLERLIREERADLVVMSAHGAAGRLEAPCGSVTEHALTHASVPLLVIRDRPLRSKRGVGPVRTRRVERHASPGPPAS